MAEHDRDQSLEVEGLAPANAPGRSAPPDRPVDVAAVAACIHDLVDHSGDDVNTVATAMGVEPAWAEGLLSGEVAEVDLVELQRMCLAMESAPDELFGVPDKSSQELLLPPPGAETDRRLPAAPVVAGIAILQAETGDDLDTVARGLGVEPAWLHAVVTGEIDSLTGAEARQLCNGLGLSPEELFDRAGAALEMGDTGEAGGAGVPGIDQSFDPFSAEATGPGEPVRPPDVGQ